VVRNTSASQIVVVNWDLYGHEDASVDGDEEVNDRYMLRRQKCAIVMPHPHRVRHNASMVVSVPYLNPESRMEGRRKLKIGSPTVTPFRGQKVKGQGHQAY